ncbi:MAG: hypothetical protein OEY23_26325 [Acidimicrobiia bacterium]|nr:hypothetical protein [Acidimicrobiia bacterium]
MAGNPLDDTQRAEIIGAAEALLERYHEAFLEGTRADLEALVHLPVAYITETEVQLRDRYPFDPEKLRARSDFHHGETTTTFVHVEPTRVHALIEGTRHRADGSVIESIESVYILQDRGDGWKVAAFSGIRGARARG